MKTTISISFDLLKNKENPRIVNPKNLQCMMHQGKSRRNSD